MKKAKLNQKLNLKKEQVANLSDVKGGVRPTWKCVPSIDFGQCVSMQIPCVTHDPACL